MMMDWLQAFLLKPDNCLQTVTGKLGQTQYIYIYYYILVVHLRVCPLFIHQPLGITRQNANYASNAVRDDRLQVGAATGSSVWSV